jgi:hypothetical protein
LEPESGSLSKTGPSLETGAHGPQTTRSQGT